jgi:hypothetical protein
MIFSGAHGSGASRHASRALAGALALAATALAPATASAQRAPAVEVDEESSDRRRPGELVAFALSATTYGLRVGTMIEWAVGRRANDGEPETFWILPGALALAGATGALLVDHYHPLRRGRAFSVGSATIAGYLGSLALSMQLRGEAVPSAVSLTGPATFIGSTAGVVTGILVGHLTDARPGPALFVATGAVGSTLMGAFLCGALRCGSDLGAWALTGEAIGIVATLASVNAFNPTARDMRLSAIGAIGGLLPAASALGAYVARDGGVTETAWARVSAMALGGIVLGGVAGYAIGRSTRPSRSSSGAVAVLPSFGAGLGRSLGVTVMGEL